MDIFAGKVVIYCLQPTQIVNCCMHFYVDYHQWPYWNSSIVLFQESNWLKRRSTKGQIVPHLDGRQYAFPITCNLTMITDISASVLQRTIGWFVFVSIIVAVCVQVCSAHAQSMIVVDKEWYVWLNCFSNIPNATEEAIIDMAKYHVSCHWDINLWNTKLSSI